MALTDWLPYETAPKDGTMVQLRAEDEGPFEMYWDADRLGMVSTSKGVWVLRGGGMTWCDELPAGAPTHWAPLP